MNGARGGSVEEVSPEKWPSFFVDLSRSHEGWLVTLRLIEATGRAVVLAERSALAGISCDGRRIVIALGGDHGTSFTHVIEDPESVRVETLEARVETAIEIRSGRSILEVRFRSALPTEMIDGVA